MWINMWRYYYYYSSAFSFRTYFYTKNKPTD